MCMRNEIQRLGQCFPKSQNVMLALCSLVWFSKIPHGQWDFISPIYMCCTGIVVFSLCVKHKVKRPAWLALLLLHCCCAIPGPLHSFSAGKELLSLPTLSLLLHSASANCRQHDWRRLQSKDLFAQGKAVKVQRFLGHTAITRTFLKALTTGLDAWPQNY